MKIAIAKGNTKLGFIPNISLPPIKACGNCSCCKKTCYALKAWRMYRETRLAWSRNMRIYKASSEDYFNQVNSYLEKTKPMFFRWHASGDILDQAYLEGMINTARLNPSTNFLCFTKMYELDYSALPNNLRIVFSAWPGLPMSNGRKFPVSYMRDENNLDSRIPSDARLCPGHCDSCGMCWSLRRGESVVFNRH